MRLYDGNLMYYCKNARAPKKTEGDRVVAPWLVDKVYSKPSLHRIRIRAKELPDDQHACAGSARSQQVFLGGSGAQIRKDLGVAEKV